MSYYLELILPDASGFGAWHSVAADGACYDDESDLVHDLAMSIDGLLYELGVNDLPAHIEDIRGSVYQQPDRVFAYEEASAAGPRLCYCGIRAYLARESVV